MITAIIKKELLQLRRDPRLIAMIVVMPLVFLVLFGVRSGLGGSMIIK